MDGEEAGAWIVGPQRLEEFPVRSAGCGAGKLL